MGHPVELNNLKSRDSSAAIHSLPYYFQASIDSRRSARRESRVLLSRWGRLKSATLPLSPEKICE